MTTSKAGSTTETRTPRTPRPVRRKGMQHATALREDADARRANGSKGSNDRRGRNGNNGTGRTSDRSDHSDRSDTRSTNELDSTPDRPAADSHRKIVVRESGVHGKGVYALRTLKKGERIIEYKGEHIDWPEALRRHPHDPAQPNHTFYFALDDDSVIDGRVQGNSARWINHSCEPNCEAALTEVRGRQRVFIEALRNIKPGEELFYDYGLVIDKPLTKKLKAEYACWCGSKQCRGTLLATSK